MTDIGTHFVEVQATDGFESVISSASVAVIVNNAPTPMSSVILYSLIGVQYFHTFPPATDPEGDDIIYRMKFQNGSALDPRWITFDNTTLDLVYTVPDESPQFINLVMQVADIYNPIVSEVVLLEVNDAPKLNTSISTVYSMISKEPTTITIPGHLFTDDGVLTYSFAMVNGSAQPAWMTIDTPDNSSTGDFEISCTYPILETTSFQVEFLVEDEYGESAQTTFTFFVIGKFIS